MFDENVLINVPFQSQQDAIAAFWDVQDKPFQLTEDDVAAAMGALNGTMGAVQGGGMPAMPAAPGAPMDPSMGMNPNMAAPMDPNVMAGQAPMDPNMMAPAAPMDPAMGGIDPMTGMPMQPGMMGPDPQVMKEKKDNRETFGTNLEQLKQLETYIDVIVQSTQDQRIQKIQHQVQTILNTISDQGEEILKNDDLDGINYDIATFIDTSVLEIRDILQAYIKARDEDAKKKFGKDPFGEHEEDEEQEKREEDLESDKDEDEEEKPKPKKKKDDEEKEDSD